MCMSSCTLSHLPRDALHHVAQQQSSHKMWCPNLELPPTSTVRNAFVFFVGYPLWCCIPGTQHMQRQSFASLKKTYRLLNVCTYILKKKIQITTHSFHPLSENKCQCGSTPLDLGLPRGKRWLN